MVTRFGLSGATLREPCWIHPQCRSVMWRAGGRKDWRLRGVAPAAHNAKGHRTKKASLLVLRSVPLMLRRTLLNTPTSSGGMSRRTASSDSDSRSRPALRTRPIGFEPTRVERLPVVRCSLSRCRSSWISRARAFTTSVPSRRARSRRTPHTLRSFSRAFRHWSLIRSIDSRLASRAALSSTPSSVRRCTTLARRSCSISRMRRFLSSPVRIAASHQLEGLGGFLRDS